MLHDKDLNENDNCKTVLIISRNFTRKTCLPVPEMARSERIYILAQYSCWLHFMLCSLRANTPYVTFLMVTFPILYMTQYAKVFVSIPFIYISAIHV